MPKQNLGISHFAVSRAIDELQNEHDLVTSEMIAQHIRGSRSTVSKCIQDLKRAELITVLYGSSRSGGYRYEYTGR